jgi:cell cycle checkpoint control protein RAD9A
MADNDSLLHTQLWIDPKEEFLQYVHTGDPVDVTFSVKELKVQLAKPFDFDCSSTFKF